MGTYWTIQSNEKWNEIQEKGYLTGNPNFIWLDFIEAYYWMMKKMSEYIPNYKGEYPVWLWTEKPDLRKSGYLERGEEGILLKIDIEESRVLHSDFQAWHFVLMKEYFDLEQIEEDNRQFVQSELEKSWEMIFNIDYLISHPNWGERVCTIQGVTNYIDLSEITLLKKFIAK